MAAPRSDGVLLSKLREAAGPGRVVRLRRGEQLFRRLDRVTSVYVLRSGRVRLERTLSDGSSATVHVARGPALLAEASLFASEYHCDAVAEVASTVLALDRCRLGEAVVGDAELSRLLLQRLAAEVRELRGRLELRSVRPVERRVLLGLELDPWVDRTVAQRAAELGLAPETLSRALAKLEREGRIERRGRSVRRTGEEIPRKA